ncbi:MAG: efflux RND transporter periplasmic adaptor subunit [Cyclobacteriaceae bacterium]|nr:efflux RND transporter periplasmic adaptor subunit [Cyclobacteriaceae bacterium]MCB0498286.1 efflux RND transporter periplasmic adaptor subunit [Cyclobacteriaceae bacterium]MCB9239010.1 efflux RND transporter periplasmic adaptor subunit [Flammeovirgaceae bacterium]MCO5270732.1 efflux RND transporter periplasmic adaptor subunit [Cyclobacteriaceae bacterium]MCW5900830.1 efflux RND transporter periplasmic adaptor subunit [Cyclobacteriaceae bacterium]
MKNIFQNKYVLVIITLIIGVTIGWIINSPSNQSTTSEEHQHANGSEIWTCSMHPQIRQSEPGLCPICGMELIPLGNDDDGGDPLEVKMSETAMKLANIQTTIVGMGNSVKEVRLNGKVQADERRKSSQAAHIPGRIEQLLVNFTGEYVQKGQMIAQIYSPELVTAQQELFEANKIKDTQPELFVAAREKLKNWKLTDKQIDAIIASGTIRERFPLLADVSGVVLERRVSVGDYVMRGAPIYDVADLSRVWVLFDVYESDMPWIKKNSDIEFTIKSLPGETFREKVSFIDPVINPETRVATARVEMANSGMHLKPEMFASGVVKSNLKAEGGMVVPKSAVLWTGERSVVYVKNVNDNKVSFRMTEVTLGPSLGDSYIIKDGLTVGQEVVTNGTFTIDAAAQLAGKPSMMNPPAGGGAVMTGHQHGETNATPQPTEDHSKHQMGATFEVNDKFKNQIGAVLHPYLKLKDAFVNTNSAEASSAAKEVKATLGKVDMKLVKGDAHNAWMKLLEALNSSVATMSTSPDVEVQRQSFSTFTDQFYAAIQQFNVSGLEAYYQFCPMANNNKGAYWISKTSTIQNPYFGNKMMRCGETKLELK